MRFTLLIVAAAVYVSTVVAANVLTSRYGQVGVGFGLVATAGTYAAGLAFLARDAVHRAAAHPRRITLALTLTGALLSYMLALPLIAVASAVAFAVSELVDLIVFEATQRGGFVVSSTTSNVVGAVVDTLVFLPIAGFAFDAHAVAGQIVGKLTVTGVFVILAALSVAVVRRAVSVQPVD
jgi:uncharacterized PurR-regulated membrane protein YhhQ (DUF165 family)